MHRIAIVSLLVLLMASSALAAPTWGVSFSRICEDAVTQLRVIVWNEDPDHPNLPEEFTIIRTTTAPGLADPLVLTTDPIPLPPYGEQTVVLLPDPGVPAEAIGYYECWATFGDGSEVLTDEGALSCVTDPYLMRALLITDDVAEPCEGIGLLECTSVLLSDLDMLDYVGTGELVDIYGWPVWLNDVNSCGINVTRIEPLDDGATCKGVVALQPKSWSSVKSFYR